MENSQTQVNYWQEFRDELMERLRTPRKHPTFVFYFFGIIVFVGGFGLLEPLGAGLFSLEWTENETIRLISACYTYSVCIAATAAVDLMLSLHQRKSLLMLFVVCCFVVFLCAMVAAHQGIVALAICGYILALLLWWVGHAHNVNLLDTPSNPDVTTGGATQEQPTGDLSDFTS